MFTWFAKNHTFLTIVPTNWTSYIIMCCYALGLWRFLAGAEFCEIFFRDNRKFWHIDIGPSLQKTNISFFVYARWETILRKSNLVKWLRTIFRHAKPSRELQFMLEWRLFTLSLTHVMLHALIFGWKCKPCLCLWGVMSLYLLSHRTIVWYLLDEELHPNQLHVLSSCC